MSDSTTNWTPQPRVTLYSGIKKSDLLKKVGIAPDDPPPKKVPKKAPKKAPNA